MRESLSRAAVVGAARELLMSEGLSGLSLRRLAARLDVTAAALYAYVDNKRDLLQAVIEGEFERLVSDFERDGRADNPIARMCHMAWAYVRYARENPRVFRTMFMFRAQLEGQSDGNDFATASRAFAVAQEPLVDAMEQGLIARTDPVMASLTMWTAIHGAATVLLLGPNLDAQGAEQLARSVITTVLRGLCTERGLRLLDAVILPPPVEAKNSDAALLPGDC